MGDGLSVLVRNNRRLKLAKKVLKGGGTSQGASRMNKFWVLSLIALSLSAPTSAWNAE